MQFFGALADTMRREEGEMLLQEGELDSSFSLGSYSCVTSASTDEMYIKINT